MIHDSSGRSKYSAVGVCMRYLRQVLWRCAPALLWSPSPPPQSSSPPQRWAPGILDKNTQRYCQPQPTLQHNPYSTDPKQTKKVTVYCSVKAVHCLTIFIKYAQIIALFVICISQHLTSSELIFAQYLVLSWANLLSDRDVLQVAELMQMCTDQASYSPNRCLPYSMPRNKADHLAVWRRGVRAKSIPIWQRWFVSARVSIVRSIYQSITILV